MKIETATIRRLRDGLLESGRREATVVSSAYETLTRAGLLSDRENAAMTRVEPLAETAFLMMTADGRIDEAERQAIVGAIRGLTDGLLQDGTIKVMLETFTERVADAGRSARLEAVAKTLSPNPADAERAFALAAAVALADENVDTSETALVEDIADLFDITPERARAILGQLEDDKTASG